MMAHKNHAILLNSLKEDYLEIIRLRQSLLNITDTEIADYLGVKYPFAHKLLTNQTFSVKYFYKILEFLNIPLINLIKDEDKEKWEYVISLGPRKPTVASVSQEQDRGK